MLTVIDTNAQPKIARSKKEDFIALHLNYRAIYLKIYFSINESK
jgi:hypothetical protein